MSSTQLYKRINHILELIENRKTGSPAELAKKLCVTERTVYNIMDTLRGITDRPITYSKEDNSYIYVDKNK